MSAFTPSSALIELKQAQATIPALTELLNDEQNTFRHLAAAILKDIGPEAKTAIATLSRRLS